MFSHFVASRISPNRRLSFRIYGQVIRGADPSAFHLRPLDAQSPSNRLQRVLDAVLEDLRAHGKGIQVPFRLAGKPTTRSWSDDEVQASIFFFGHSLSLQYICLCLTQCSRVMFHLPFPSA